MNRADEHGSSLKAAAGKAAAFFVEWQLLWVALLAPLFLFPPVGKPWLLLILLLPFPWIVSAARRESPLPVTPLNGALALMAFMVLVSLWATYDISFSAPKVLGVVLGLAVFFATVRSVRGAGRVALALDLFVAAGTTLACIGLLGTNWIGKVPGVVRITARLPAMIRGVPGQSEGFQPNAIAGALTMFIPLQIAAVVRSDRRVIVRVVHAMALLLTGGTLVLTQSRGGWIAFVVAMCAWFLWQGRRTRLTAIVVLSAVAVVATASWSHLGPLLVRSFGTGIRSDRQSRLELWSSALSAIGDFPITGMGMNTFRRTMPLLYPTSTALPENDIAHAHNHLLQVALDLGLPGLIAYLALWSGAAALLTISIRRARRNDERWIVGGLAAGMIAYFVFGTADAIALGAKVGIFFWVALALIVTLHDATARGEGAGLP